MYKSKFQPGDSVCTLSFGENGSKSLDGLSIYFTRIDNVITYEASCRYKLQCLEIPKSEIAVAKDANTLVKQISNYLLSKIPK